jgi:RHS repeat-associated protein
VAVCNPQVDPNTNKLIGYQFDSSGNTKTDASGQTFIYDAENKQVEVRNASNAVVGQYFYDGDGKRVKKIVPSTGETTIFIYDASGKMVAEYSTIVATPINAKISYLTSDHLGSPRVNTDATGQVIARHDYQPFGEEIQRANYGADSTRQKFTGQQKDNETALDYFKARYFSSAQGRFTSPDPITITPYRLVTPQALNGYSYVANNPLKFTDPTGKQINFKNQAAADKALQLYQNGLEKDEQKYVSTVKNKDGTFSLKVDEKAGKAADSDSLLGRLYKASTATQVAVISIGKKDMEFSMTVFSADGKSTTTKTSLKQLDDADKKVSNLAGLTLFPAESKDKANPKSLAPNAYSSEKNATQIIVATDDSKYTPTQAIYAETLAHFGEFVRTGNPSASTHSSSVVTTIEDDAVERSGENEQDNKNTPAPATKKPQ